VLVAIYMVIYGSKLPVSDLAIIDRAMFDLSVTRHNIVSNL
jgi:hypothetical protein